MDHPGKKEILGLIEEYGAINLSLLRQTYPSLPREEACRLLGRFVGAGVITFIPALPKQAIFFALPEDSDKFALSLRRAKRLNGEGSSLYTIDQLMIALGKNREGLSVAELMVETGRGRDTINRALDSLIRHEQAIREGPFLPSGGRGRPSYRFKLTELGYQGVVEHLKRQKEKADRDASVVVDFSKESKTSRRQQNKTRPKRGSRG